jgi:RNA polymerase sigma-70 factor (ECF subfamily)
MVDDLVLARAKRGDRDALDQLLRANADRIYTVARRLMGNEADANDASQEAMIAIVRGLPRFDGRSALSTWIYRVTTNACLDEMRRRRRRPLSVLDRDSTPEIPSDEPAMDTTLADRLDIDAALAQLPEDFRLVVVLRDLCGYDYAEIATTLQIPEGTVKSRIARGRAHLSNKILGNQPGRPDRRSD